MTGGNGTHYHSLPDDLPAVLGDLRSVEHLRTVGLLLICAFGTAACSYSPPNVADQDRPSYQADLTACRETADKAAHHQVIAYGVNWLIYPFSLPVLKHREMNTCMEGKGYVSNKS